MKGARRTRKPRQQAGFADLMTSSPSSNSLRGVVTGVSRAQRSNPSTPTPTRSNPTTPPPPDDDWGALLHTTPKRRFSPQKPNHVTTTPHSSSSRSSSTLSSRRASSIYSPRRTPSTPSPRQTPPSPPHQLSNTFASPPVSNTPPSNPASQTEKSTPVPAFLSGWDGAEGWGDDPPLDDSDHETQNDAWGVWPESDDFLSQAKPDIAPPQKDNAFPPHSPQPTNVRDQPHVSPAQPQLPNNEVKPSSTFEDLSGWAVEEPPKQPIADLPEPDAKRTDIGNAPSADGSGIPISATMEEKTETVPTPNSNTPGDKTEPTAGFDGFSSWAVEEPPKQPVGEFLEPDTQQIDGAHDVAADNDIIPTSAEQEEQSVSVPVADSLAPKNETDTATDVDAFSGWVEEEPPQQPAAEVVKPDTPETDAVHATATGDGNVPTSAHKEVQLETPPTAEPRTPEIEANATAGFDDFSGWAVEEPPQQPVPEFPEPGAQQTDAALGFAAEDGDIPRSIHGEVQPEAVPMAEPHICSDNVDTSVAFDGSSGWTAEEPPQQPVGQFPGPNTQQTNAAHDAATEDNNITITQNEEQHPGSFSVIEDQAPRDEAGVTAGFDTFSGWAVEEPSKQPVAEPLLQDTRPTDVVHSGGSQGADLHVVSKDDVVPETDVYAPANAEVKIDASQQATGIESASHPHGNDDDNARWATEASAQPAIAEASLSVDPWALNDTSANARGEGDGWGWGVTTVIPPVHPEPAENLTMSESTFVTASTAAAAEKENHNSPVASSLAERKEEQPLENAVKAASVEERESESQHHDSQGAVLAEQPAGGNNGLETNESGNEVNLDDWRWGGQAEGGAVEFSISANPSELELAGPPPSNFSHVPDNQAPANEWWNSSGDQSFRAREENTGQSDDVNTTAGDRDSNIANAYDITNADFSMYAPNKGNVEEDDNAKTQIVDGAAKHQYPMKAEQPEFKRSGGEAESSHVGVAEISFNKQLFAEGGAVARHEKDVWTTDVGVPHSNVPSSNTGPTLVTCNLPPPASEHEKVVDVDKSGTQVRAGTEVPQGEANEVSAEYQNDTSYLWRGFGNVPKSEPDRLWANPDAVWPAPPVPVPSVVTAENENKKDAHATLEVAVGTKNLSESAPPAELPSLQDPQPIARSSISDEAPDLSSSSFENNVPYPPIERQMFQRRVADPAKASAPSDVMISGSGKHSPLLPSEKIRQNENSMVTVDWEQSLHSNQQPQMPISSGVSDPPRPENQARSNSYWTERLDESKSVLPHNANRTTPEASHEHQNAEGYENTSWSPSRNTSQTESTATSAPAFSDAHTASREYSSGGTQMTESVTGPWAPSGGVHHHNGPQNMQWPASKLLHEDSNVANQPGIARKPQKIDRDESADQRTDRGQVLPREPSTTDAMTTGRSPPIAWNQYAPRGNARGDQVPSSVPSSQAEPPQPVQQSVPDSHGVNFGDDIVSADASTYDPFAVYPDESTLDKTTVPDEAFDWGYDAREASTNPQMFPAASSIVEGRESNEGESRLQQDMSSRTQSSPPNADKQSNIAPMLPTPNFETNVQQPLPDIRQQTFPIPDTFQINSDASRDLKTSDPEGLSQSVGKKPSVQPVSGIPFQSESAEVLSMESRGEGECILGDSTPQRNDDEMRSSVQHLHSPNSGIDVDSYAPRIITSRPPTDNTSVPAHQGSFQAFDVQDIKPEFPQGTAPLELTAPMQTPHQVHVPAYQPIVPDAPASYSMNAPYAPSAPSVPETGTANGSEYPQTGSDAIEFTSSTAAPEIEPTLEQTHSEIPTIASHPLGHSAIPTPLGETGEMNATIANNEIRSLDHHRRDGDISSQSLDQHVLSTGTVAEPQGLSSDPWSSYSTVEVPGSTSAASETAATQWSNVGTAYSNVEKLGHEQVRGGFDTIPDQATETHGSYAMTNEPNYGQDLPPPPQQVPYTPASYLGDQDMFQAESIVDPSAFSYPYSIMDTEITGDFSSRPQRPLFSWGFGGKLVSVIPHVKTGSEADVPNTRSSADATSSPTVHIHDLQDITRDGSNDDWAAASEAVPPVSFPTRTSDLSSYAEMCDRLSKLSVGLKGADAEGRAALWRVLALRCREGTADWRLHASSAVCGPSSVPMFGKNDSSSRFPGNSNIRVVLKEDELDLNTSGIKKTDAATEVERLLTLGRGRDAIHVAQEAGLWSVALVLAATMERSLYLEVVSGYAKSALHDGSALQTLCLSVAEDESEILRKATSPSGLKEWRKTVGMLLTVARSTPSASDAQQSRSLRLIDQIGEALISKNSDVVAGHVCFMISGRLGPLSVSNIPLLGADPKLPAGQPRGLGSPAAVLQSLVLEAIENAASGVTYPHLLPHRLVLAEEICAVGRPEVALAHCESISCAVRSLFESGRQDIASQCFTLPFLSRLEALEQRLLVHLGKVNKGARKGGLTALGKSLSSVFTKGLTTVSRGGQPQRYENRRESMQSTEARNMPSLPPQPGPTAPPPLNPAKLDVPALQPQSTMQPSLSILPEQPPNDANGNERWNSLVSKTIGFLAPAEGDLSPPLKARNDQGVPFHEQPVPLGLGGGAANRVPTFDSHAGHMRSASVGDVPMLERREPAVQTLEQSSYSHHFTQGSHSQTGSNHPSRGNSLDQTAFNGVPVHKTTATESHMSPTHRRAASDMTFESQTSEKKPPRPPKKSPTLPSGIDLQPKREKVQAVKGWRSRLSEKIRAAFSGPPRAHMGVENKFKYDKERGRWVIEGEDPDENNNEPPPPPEDDPTPGGQTSVPYNQSYESLPNPDLGNHFSSDSQTVLYQSDNEFNREGSQMERVRRYSHGGQVALGNIPADNGYSRDTGSESSAASAASAPTPYSSEPTIPVIANPGNKFRARPGRSSGRRAYVDTLNKGTPPVAMSAAFPNPARPRPPVMNGSGLQAGGGYRIFTPSPVPLSHGSNDESSGVPGNEGGPITSSTVHSNENLYQTRATPPSDNGPGGGSFGNDFKPRAPVQSA